MNPETEVLVPNPRDLMPGMVVLIEDINERAVIKDKMADWEEYRALERNRWCSISDVAINEDFIVFTGTYEDDTQRRRTAHVSKAWLVKKDSIDESLKQYVNRRRNVFELIREALKDALGNEYNYNSTRIAQETTNRILKLL
jgi:hypothetical protein